MFLPMVIPSLEVLPIVLIVRFDLILAAISIRLVSDYVV